MSAEPALDLVLLWHHHQPDYRSPRDGRALLPWVRLHAAKDYLDMAVRLERHPRVKSTFNFVPSLLDQLESAQRDAPEALFDLLRRPSAELAPTERAEVVARCASAPRHALERWPEYRRLCELVARTGNGTASVDDATLLRLEVFFLLAWIDPLFHDEPEARDAIAHLVNPRETDRGGLLRLHDRLVARVVPAYRELAERGQVELSTSPYYHPSLPLLIDLQSARRARADLPLPVEAFAHPEDARAQIDRALERHALAFGRRPAGMWPPEGSVSPEAAELAADAGVRWLASDEGVLWASLGESKREALYRPWSLATPAGEVAFFFRDHELSDRIGFVYQHWDPAQAVDDFLERLRRIAREHRGDTPPVVSVILDGENCWEHYPEDGGPFLDRLYAALESATDVRTRTPSEVIVDGKVAALSRLHSGSWINADFRIWIGHPEKNRAWDLLARARNSLVERGVEDPRAWDALAAAEGSDWFWWFGDDHFTADKAIFDGLFREHLQGVYQWSGAPVPGWLEVPIAGVLGRRAGDQAPLAFVAPVIDGRRTGFYEWHGAGRFRLGAGGGSMHRAAGLASDLYFGFDLERLCVRLDFAAEDPPGAGVDFVVEVLSPVHRSVRVRGLERGPRQVVWSGGMEDGAEISEAACHLDQILELAVPFARLGLARGQQVELLAHLFQGGRSVETLPGDRLVRFQVPDESFELAMWSA